MSSRGCSGPSLGWRVLLTMAQSMVPGQQTAAWNSLAALPVDADSGYALTGPIGRLTRTAAKWWIATRPAWSWTSWGTHVIQLPVVTKALMTDWKPRRLLWLDGQDGCLWRDCQCVDYYTEAIYMLTGQSGQHEVATLF